ncbi:sterol desaturase family protein [Fulvivirga sp. 29W222]|uniref:Sterol desaturase family protein n=1 Tax=Fulvivirga marina TaxID=2494733 RepID=A0A937G3D5_9BACT|nr:sterol desaturase family protein [Fulvivirga marina]MBL6449952.1 sterol desaturase family protein [Fulvivirga marina]
MKASNLLSYVAVPLLLILTGGLTYLCITEGWNKELMTYALFLLTFAYILLLEHSIPLKAHWKSKKQSLLTDLKHLFFSTAIFDALAKAVAIGAILKLHEYHASEMVLWQDLPFIASFIIANLIGELLPYLYHRISHIGNHRSAFSVFLWKIHAIHHLPTSMNWFKTNWIHPFNIFLNTFFKIAPLLMLGFGEDILFAVAMLHMVVAYLSHANIQAHTGILDYLIVTPKIHHFHHSTNMTQAKNYGSILPFWDQVFGTFYNKNEMIIEVGIIENDKLQYPDLFNYLDQLRFPVISKDCC